MCAGSLFKLCSGLRAGSELAAVLSNRTVCSAQIRHKSCFALVLQMKP